MRLFRRHSRRRPDSSIKQWLLGWAIALVFLPIALDLVASDERRPFGYVAADYFFYAVIAENIAETGQASFDGERSTNAFHPLWGYTLGAAQRLANLFGVPRDGMVALSVVLGSVFLSLGLLLVIMAAQREGNRCSALWVMLPVGVYALFLSPVWWFWDERMRTAELYRGEGTLPLYGTLWSYVNGMESAILIMTFGMVAYWYVRHGGFERRRDAAVLGLLLAGFVFARLDHVFFAAALAGIVSLRACLQRTRGFSARTALLLATFVAPIGLYLLFNAIVHGSPVPVSGQLKSSFPVPGVGNLPYLLRILREEALRHPSNIYRYFQLIVPVLVATMYLLWVAGTAATHRRRRQPPRVSLYDQLLIATALGVISLGAYGFFFVRWWAQGHWYFPVSILFVSLAVIRLLQNLSLDGWLKQKNYRLAVWMGIWTALTLLYFAKFHRQTGYHALYARFLHEEAPRIRAYYEARGDSPKLLSDDDGIVAFATGFPTMSTGLALDSEGVRHRQAGTFFELAQKRGHDRLTTLYYGDFSRFAGTPRSRRYFARRWRIRDPDRFEMELEYSAPHLGFGIVRVQQRLAPPQR